MEFSQHEWLQVILKMFIAFLLALLIAWNWTTGALGIAVAYGRVDIAIIISLVNYLMLRVMTDVKNNVQKKEEQ